MPGMCIEIPKGKASGTGSMGSLCRKDMHQTGQEIQASGIYRVSHGEHRLPSEVELIAGNRFPRCGKCGNPVTFELLRDAPSPLKRSNVVVHEMTARERRVDEKRAA